MDDGNIDKLGFMVMLERNPQRGLNASPIVLSQILSPKLATPPTASAKLMQRTVVVNEVRCGGDLVMIVLYAATWLLADQLRGFNAGHPGSPYHPM